MTPQIDNDVNEAKRLAKLELDAHRARVRAEQAAREAAAMTADMETAALVKARRAEEERRAETEAARQRLYARRDAQIEAERQADQERKLAINPSLRIANTPARRIAKTLRARLGDDFELFIADIRGVGWQEFKNALARIPDDERAEALHRRQEEMAARLQAEAANLPVPESPEEQAILARHGFPVSPYMFARRAELDGGVL